MIFLTNTVIKGLSKNQSSNLDLRDFQQINYSILWSGQHERLWLQATFLTIPQEVVEYFFYLKVPKQQQLLVAPAVALLPGLGESHHDHKRSHLLMDQIPESIE